MEEPPSPGPSDVSMRSARSMNPSDVSMRSARSMNPSDVSTWSASVHMEDPPSPGPSDVPMRSASSTEHQSMNRGRALSPARSCVSMESDYSSLEIGRKRRLGVQGTCETTHNQKLRIMVLEKENSELKTSYKALKHENTDLTNMCMERKLLDTEEGQLEMVKMRAECVQEPALGRPIHPGMLYDCRSESFSSVPLWDSDAVRKGTVSQSHTAIDTQVIEKQSLKNRCLALGMNKRMSTSFLSGMVEVGGAANYLSHNTIDFGRGPSRMYEYNCVTLHYKKSIRVEQLCSSLLEKVTRPEVIQQQTATHVVMAVTYGTQAFLVFQSDVEPSDIPAETLAYRVRGLIPCCRLMAQEVAQPLLDEDATCAYYGDHGAQRVMSDSKEVVDLCRSLPNLLGPNGEKAVPLTVWLYPLNKLDPAAACVREISRDLQTRMEKELKDCRRNELLCESMKSKADQYVPSAKKIGFTKRIKQNIKEAVDDLFHNKSLAKTALVTLRYKIQNERFLLSELERLSSANTSVDNIRPSFNLCYLDPYDDDDDYIEDEEDDEDDQDDLDDLYYQYDEYKQDEEQVDDDDDEDDFEDDY